jgi:AraC-like DNA-binding protein
LAECVENLSHDPAVLDEILRRSSLSRNAILPNKTVDALKEPKFINEACEVLADPAFGAKAGLLFRNGTSLNSYIAKYSQNLRAAFENSGRYYSILDPAFNYSLAISGNAASFQLECRDPEFSQFHRHIEFLLFAALGRARSLTSREFHPIEIRFNHEVKSAAKAIQKLAACPVVFGAEVTEMILPLATLDLPIPSYEPNLQKHLIEYGDKLLKDLPDRYPSLEVKIKNLLAGCLPGRIASANDIALSLGMSKRTFARRLNGEGASFRKIVDDVRCDLAKVYLKDKFSISEVAFYLDYADQAAFSTAFKRWMGCSPKEYRTKQALQNRPILQPHKNVSDLAVKPTPI